MMAASRGGCGLLPMQTSVVVSTYNRRDVVLRTVRTLLQQDFPRSEYEIVVVVDGSRDGTAEALHGLGAGVRVVVQENRGLAGARNTGTREAAGELLLFLDDDMKCVPELVREHVAAHAESKGIAGLGAIYVAPDHPRNLAAELFNRGLGASYLRQREHPGEAWPENVWSFGNTSIRRDVLERAGGFDERFRMREDGELGVRLLQAGVRQRFVAGAVAYQWCDKSAGQLVRDAETFAASDLLFMRSHPGSEPHDFLRNIREEGLWKRRIRRLLLRHPEIADLALAPVCALGDAVPVGPLRRAAARALLLRCGVHWLHRLVELSGMPVEEWLAGK
jgi:GT2 family glycosyltransferase